METLLIVAAVIFIFYFIFKFFFGSKGGTKEVKEAVIYRYDRKDFLMTQAESRFFKMLVEVAGDRYYVFPQVHLSALLDHKVVGQDWKPAFRHINGKSVDFVLCDKASLKPVYAVELDDKSHETAVRQIRDREVERIFMGADLPLVRFTNYRNLSHDDIAKRFYEAHTSQLPA